MHVAESGKMMCLRGRALLRSGVAPISPRLKTQTFDGTGKY